MPVLVPTTIAGHEVHRRFLDAGANEVLLNGIGFGDILAAVRGIGGEE